MCASVVDLQTTFVLALHGAAHGKPATVRPQRNSGSMHNTADALIANGRRVRGRLNQVRRYAMPSRGTDSMSALRGALGGLPCGSR